MGLTLGAVKTRQQGILTDAARRWEERMKQRETGLEKIRNQGPGAADTPKRQAEWTARQLTRAAGGFPLFPERVIGAWNPVEYAPSVQASDAAKPVARIVQQRSAGHTPIGVATGLLIGFDLLLTNHHVFPSKIDVDGHAANFFYVRDEYGINNGKYYDFDPDRFFVTDPDLDFTIVAVQPRSRESDQIASCGWTRLIEATGKVLTGAPVNIIQHPAGGPRAFAISDNKLMDILPTGFLHYETDTRPGSSGSPVYNTDWELVALHHCGVPAMRDGRILDKLGAPWDPESQSDDDIQWIANEGARVSFIVERLKSMSIPESMRMIARQLLATTADPLTGTESVPAGTASSSLLPLASRAGGGNTFNFSGPVTLHVYGGQALQPGVPAAAAPVSVPAPAAPAQVRLPDGSGAPSADGLFTAFQEKSLVFDEDYAGRKGYNPKFLGQEVPAPVAQSRWDGALYSVADYEEFNAGVDDVPAVKTSHLAPADPLPLDYHHFSLVMHKPTRMCLWTASNYDYRPKSRTDPRKRADFGGENWREDPRLPLEYQLLNKDVYGPAKRIDRGHIVRREDNCWGADADETEFANADSYHWPNCTPQHEAFNQENPNDRSGQRVYEGGVVGIWGQFERLLTDQVQQSGGRAVLFAGPVLTEFFESKNWGAGKVKIPKKFWKVVVVPESQKRGAKLLAYGFVFSQEKPIRQFGDTYESIDMPAFERNQAAIAEIEELAGLKFDPKIVAADQYAGQ